MYLVPQIEKKPFLSFVKQAAPSFSLTFNF